MNKKLKGFSLAELLISLLIISIVLSAAIPAVTKKQGQQRENIWRWTEQNHVAYTGVGANQSVILGLDTLPLEDADIATLMKDKDEDDIGKINLGNIKYSSYGDKLAILKRKIDSSSSNFVNSHISFFNMDNGAGETTAEYGGRLAMDGNAIALGIGSLQSVSDKDEGGKDVTGNTAIGHYSLLKNTTGKRNTAIGNKTLAYNETGSKNTAIGRAALRYLGKTIEENPELKSADENTAVGSDAMKNLQAGSSNIAIGYNSAPTLVNGSSNTVLGWQAFRYATSGNFNTIVGAHNMPSFKSGVDNVSIGYNSCPYLSKGDYNICIGTSAGGSNQMPNDDYGIYIGGMPKINGEDSDDVAPIIGGHTNKVTVSTSAGEGSGSIQNTYDQELQINARRVVFQPYLGRFPIFEFETLYGQNIAEDKYGYAPADVNRTRYGVARFNLRDTGSSKDGLGGSSVSMLVRGIFPDTHSGKILRFDAYNPYFSENDLESNLKLYPGDKTLDNTEIEAGDYADIFFNNMLLFDFPTTGADDEHNNVNIGLYNSIFTTNEEGDKIGQSHIPLGINGRMFIAYDVDTPTVAMNPKDGFKLELLVNEDNAETGAKKGYGLLHFKGNESSMFMQLGTKSYLKAGMETNGDKRANAGFQFDGGDDSDPESMAPFIVHAGCATKPAYGYDGTPTSMIVDDCRSVIDIRDVVGISRYNVSFGAIAKYVTENNDYINIATDGNLVNLLKFIVGKLRNIEQTVNPTSDIRLKNIQGDYTLGLNEINKLEVKNYTYKDDEKKTPHVGVIAQQLKKVFPNAVTMDEKGFLKIRQEDMFYAMINSIKELYHQIQDLTAKITGLDKRITELEKQNKLLKEQNAAFAKRFAALEKKQSEMERKQVKLEKKQINLEKKQIAASK